MDLVHRVSFDANQLIRVSLSHHDSLISLDCRLSAQLPKKIYFNTLFSVASIMINIVRCIGKTILNLFKRDSTTPDVLARKLVR